MVRLWAWQASPCLPVEHRGVNYRSEVLWSGDVRAVPTFDHDRFDTQTIVGGGDHPCRSKRSIILGHYCDGADLGSEWDRSRVGRGRDERAQRRAGPVGDVRLTVVEQESAGSGM